ncbi:MAG TPA: class I SAM-dependent methyltransferase [Thermoanaerobaculia bacterium]|nr:class I SAM-dependent methyltransferase [Thermoanaerobaculia bacterium]
MKYLHAAYIDLRLWLTGKSEKGLPPLRLRDVGGGDFKRIGEELAALLIRHGLKPEHRVLDIGCGVGRVALPLTRHLTTGTYDGFDIVKRWIRWCRRHITPAHPNFRFTHADVYNSHYNRRGVPASRYRFPFDDASFDFVFATSVFTHLDPAAARHYLREAQRVLAPGGTFLGTFFLLDGELEHPALDFKIDRGDHRLLSESDPDWAIAFTPALLEELPSYTIEHGAWRNRGGEQFQDVVVWERRRPGG